MRRIDTRTLSLTAAMAAIYTIFRLVPISKLIGISGTITAAGMIIPVIALLLEPEYGVLAVILGTMIASLSPLNPLKFAGLDFLPGATNLLVVSLALRGKLAQAGAVLVGVIVLFSVTPNTMIFVNNIVSPPLPFFWLHLVALVLLVSPLSMNSLQWLQSRNYTKVAAAIGVLAFAGTMTEHLVGGVLTGLFFGPGIVRIWHTVFFLYPIERAVIVAGAILVCTPLVLNTRAVRESIMRRAEKESIPITR